MLTHYSSWLRIASLWGLALACITAMAQANDDAAKASDHWCEPSGPMLPPVLHDNSLMLQPGWVTLRMHVRPGAVPVTDVRVVSEAGGSSHARAWLPLVRRWKGCADNKRETRFDMRLSFSGVEGAAWQLPKQEGFGLYAFTSPQGAPALPKDISGVGICPIVASLKIRQPEAPNDVIEVESAGGAPVAEWLATLKPRRDYMEPNPAGNRVEFPCRVKEGGELFFYQK